MTEQNMTDRLEGALLGLPDFMADDAVLVVAGLLAVAQEIRALREELAALREAQQKVRVHWPPQ